MRAPTYAGDVQSSFIDYLRVVPGILILIVFVLLPPLGAVSIAKSICPLRKNEKSSGRIAGFISIFVVSLAALFVLMTMASMMVFGR